jgi:antitoxin HicB
MTYSLGKKDLESRKDRKMALNNERTLDPAAYLKRPYSRLVVPETDGSFRAEILEFPGCIATADTAAEALSLLEDVAASWLEATLAKGQPVPEPMEETEFSGKLVLRLPKSLHRKAAQAAKRDGVSLNQLIVSSLAEHIGERSVVSAHLAAASVLVGSHLLRSCYVRAGAFPVNTAEGFHMVVAKTKPALTIVEAGSYMSEVGAD